MNDLTQGKRLDKAMQSLELIYQEILNGKIDDDCLQAAVYCQVEINRIVFKLNELNNPD